MRDSPTGADLRRMPAPASMTRGEAFLAGMRTAIGLPGAILFASMLGFGGLAREAGMALDVAVFMTLFVWALPSQVVFVGSLMSGATLGATFIAVALSAVRLLPMTMAIVPILKGSRTPRWVMFALSHFVAVTAWVAGLRGLPRVVPERRAAWFAGVGLTLCLSNSLATTAGYLAAASLPSLVAACLVFLTPVYFLFSLTAVARTHADRFAMAFGLVAAPLLGFVVPGFGILWGGLVAGTLAYALHRVMRKRA